MGVRYRVAPLAVPGVRIQYRFIFVYVLFHRMCDHTYSIYAASGPGLVRSRGSTLDVSFSIRAAWLLTVGQLLLCLSRCQCWCSGALSEGRRSGWSVLYPVQCKLKRQTGDKDRVSEHTRISLMHRPVLSLP